MAARHHPSRESTMETADQFEICQKCGGRQKTALFMPLENMTLVVNY